MLELCSVVHDAGAVQCAMLHNAGAMQCAAQALSQHLLGGLCALITIQLRRTAQYRSPYA